MRAGECENAGMFIINEIVAVLSVSTVQFHSSVYEKKKIDGLPRPKHAASK